METSIHIILLIGKVTIKRYVIPWIITSAVINLVLDLLFYYILKLELIAYTSDTSF